MMNSLSLLSKRTIVLFFWMVGLGFVSSAIVVSGQVEPADIQVLATATQEQTDGLLLQTYFVPVDASGAPIPEPRLASAEVQLLGVADSRFAAQISDPQTPLYIALVIDASGSMRSIMPQVKSAAQSAIDQAPPNAVFTVISFNELPFIALEANSDRTLVKNAIERIEVEDRGTCLYDTVDSALGLLERQAQSPGDRTAVILFTDGKDELQQGGNEPCSTRANLQSILNRAAPTDLNAQPISIHTIGLGSDASNSNLNIGELRNIAETTGGFSAIGGAGQLNNLFRSIMEALNSQLVATALVYPRAGENSAALLLQTDSGRQLSDDFVFNASRDFQPPLLPPRVSASPLRFNEASRQYELPLSIANAQSLAAVVVEISRNGILVDSVEQTADDNIVLTFSVDNLTTNEDYLVQVRGVDPTGQLIVDEDGDVMMLAELSFTNEVAPPPPPDFVIQSVNVDHVEDILTITLDIPEIERINSYEAILVNAETGAQVGTLTTDPLINSVVTMTLPAEIQQTDGEQSYILRMELLSADGQGVTEEYQFQPEGVPQIGVLERIWRSLVAQPLIVAGIVFIIIAVIVGFLVRQMIETRRRPQVRRAPVDKTGLFESPMAPPPLPPAKPLSPPPEDSFIDPLPSNYAEMSPPHVKLTFLHTPQKGQQPFSEMIIDTFPFTIGREGGRADLEIIGDRRVSREHVRLDRQNGQIMMTDLGSGNGTFLINGNKCEPDRPVPIHGRQEVQLGPHTTILLEVL